MFLIHLECVPLIRGYKYRSEVDVDYFVSYCILKEIIEKITLNWFCKKNDNTIFLSTINNALSQHKYIEYFQTLHATKNNDRRQ